MFVSFCLQLYERMNVADALQPKSFEDGERIIQQVSGISCTCKMEFAW